MVAYSFQRRFVDPIQAEIKQQTIRAIGKRRHVQPGQTVHIFTAMRTKQCRRIGEAVCVNSLPIRLRFGKGPCVAIEGRPRLRTDRALDGFARRDGFKDWWDMRAFWEDEHGSMAEFEGVLIEWRDFSAHRIVAKREIPE